MTRRKFLQNLIKISSAVLIGGLSLAKRAVPRKFIRADKVRKYPGRLRSLPNISKQSKWSG